MAGGNSSSKGMLSNFESKLQALCAVKMGKEIKIIR